MNATQRDEFLMSCQILGTTHFVATKLPSEKFVINHTLVIAFNGIMIVPTLLLNGVAVITIFKYSQLSSKPCYFIILLQSMFDFAVGVLGIPFHIYYLANGIGGLSSCLAASLARRLMVAPIEVSISILAAMTLERCIAVIHPYAYKVQVTKKRILMITGFTAAVDFSVVTLSVVILPLIKIYVMVKVAVIFLLTAYVYIRIYMVVKRLARSQRKPNGESADKNLTKMKLILQEIRQARSCLIVVICFFALNFLPSTIAFTFFEYKNEFIQFSIRKWLLSINISNSSVNSAIFFWTKTCNVKKGSSKSIECCMICGTLYIIRLKSYENCFFNC